MVKPAVTVLMAVYDPPVEMLDQAVGSILNQTFADFEFLIVNDGSQDPYLPLWLAELAGRDPRVRIAAEPHRGLTAALNCGLDLARGDWIARQDADDWSDLSRLERQVKHFRAHFKTTVLGTCAWTHQQDGRPLWPLRLPADHAAILDRLPRANPFVHGSVMFPRKAALAVGGYREEFRCSQDYDFLWRLTERGSAANLPEALYHYRYTSGSVSATRAVEQGRAQRAIQRLAAARRHGEREDIGGALGEAASCDLTVCALFKQADHLMLSGDYRRAWAAYAELLQAYPRSALAWAKLARLGIFRAFPSLREACFR